jgi:hypothetical protein
MPSKESNSFRLGEALAKIKLLFFISPPISSLFFSKIHRFYAIKRKLVKPPGNLVRAALPT